MIKELEELKRKMQFLEDDQEKTLRLKSLAEKELKKVKI